MKSRFHLAICSALLLLATSCGSRKPSVDYPGSYEQMPVMECYERLTESYQPWETVSVPVKVELKSPAKLSLSGKAYMLKDSAVNISMRFFGMEVASLYLTTDSIYCVDKFHKLYIAESTDILAAAQLTLTDVQSLLLGRPFMPSAGELTAKTKRKLTIADDTVLSWSISPRNKPDGYDWTYKVDRTDNRISSLEVLISGHRPVSCTYSDWRDSQIGPLPGVVEFSASVRGKTVNAALRYSTGDAEFDRVNMPAWRIPRGYKRIQAAALLKSLGDL